MKRKYYLRGLGIGILVTALVFTFIGPKKMTDDEIIKRAEELGYVKAEEEPEPTINLKNLLGTGTPTPSPVPTLTATPELTPTQVLTLAPTATAVPTPTVAPAPTSTPTVKPTETPVPTVLPEPTEVPQATEIPNPTGAAEEVITADISVERGNTATAVCRKIEAAGIVENGEELKEYLVQNQMTDFINIGVYTLSSDMTFEEIANILTGR